MNSSMIIGVVIGIAISFCTGSTIRILREPVPANETPASTSDTARRERAENFFGGDPDRNILGGQELRLRW